MAAKTKTRKKKETTHETTKTTRKTKRKVAPRKKARRRKTHTPSIKAHGKTTAQRRKYIEYLSAKKKLIKDFFK